MQKQTVVLILDDEFSGDLVKISRSRHVWVCESERNSPKIKDCLKLDKNEHHQSYGVTSFILDEIDETLFDMLGNIAEHHAGDGCSLLPWSEIEVIGRKLDSSVAEIARNALGVRWLEFEVTDSGFFIRTVS